MEEPATQAAESSAEPHSDQNHIGGLDDEARENRSGDLYDDDHDAESNERVRWSTASIASDLSRVTADSKLHPDKAEATHPALETVFASTGEDYEMREGNFGNIGFFFGNWGKRTKNHRLQVNVDRQMKKSPAAIIGLCEAQATTAHVLRDSGKVATNDECGDDANVFSQRSEHNYMVVRGTGEDSCLIAARDSVASKITVVVNKNKMEGTYKQPGARRRTVAWTRLLGANITLRFSIPQLGNEVRVLVVHLHRHVANHKAGFRNQQVKFWPYLKGLIFKYNFQILMGDFNMSLWKVVPELRSCGVEISLVAWYPWKSNEGGTPMSDSCGIFVCNQKASVKLHAGLSLLHNDDENGIACHSMHRNDDLPFDLLNPDAGPGFPFENYLPKSEGVEEKLKESLTSGASRSGGVETDAVLKMKEKRLDCSVWLVGGFNLKGSHFPLCAFTDNRSRRSEPQLKRRMERWRRCKTNNASRHASASDNSSWWQSDGSWRPSFSWVDDDSWSWNSQW